MITAKALDISGEQYILASAVSATYDSSGNNIADTIYLVSSHSAKWETGEEGGVVAPEDNGNYYYSISDTYSGWSAMNDTTLTGRNGVELTSADGITYVGLQDSAYSIISSAPLTITDGPNTKVIQEGTNIMISAASGGGTVPSSFYPISAGNYIDISLDTASSVVVSVTGIDTSDFISFDDVPESITANTALEAGLQYGLTTTGWTEITGGGGGGGMTKVYTDSSLSGNGTSASPVGLSESTQSNIGVAASKADAAISMISSLGSAITLRGSVTTESDLPTNPDVGDAYLINNGSSNIPMKVWDGTEWVTLGTVPDMTGYVKTTQIPDVKSSDTNITVATAIDAAGKYTYTVTLNGTGSLYSYSFESTDENRFKVSASPVTDNVVTVSLQPQSSYMPYCEAVTSIDSVTSPVAGGFYFVYED